MQYQIQEAIDQEDKWAQVRSLMARNELLAAAVFAAASMPTLLLRLKEQQHFSALQQIERQALRERITIR